MQNKPRITFSSCLAGTLLLVTSSIASAWSGDAYLNTSVSSASGQQQNLVSSSDGAGGSILVWEDQRVGGDIYAQRLDADGRVLWQADGLPVIVNATLKTNPAVIGDGAGGAYISWTGGANSAIYLQHLDGNGAVVTDWPTQGLPISSGNDGYSVIQSDGEGGVIVAWRHYAVFTSWDIYAQRIDSNGSLHSGWSEGGMVVCDMIDTQTNQALVSDGNGGAIIVWQSFGVDAYETTAQRLDANGVRQWDAGGGNFNGIRVASVYNNQTYPQIVQDGVGGAIIVWQDHRIDYGYEDIYGQRVDASGVLQWDSNGQPLVTVTGSYQDQVRAISDTSGGAYLVWRDTRNGSQLADTYLHRIDGNGANATGWSANGTRLSAVNSNITNPALVSDGSAGVVVVWRNNVYPTNELMVQKVSSDGQLQWPGGGIEASSRPGYIAAPTAVSDGNSGLIVAWSLRESAAWEYNVFAQRVYSDGSLSSVQAPTPTAPLADASVSTPTILAASSFNDASLDVPTTQLQAQWRVTDTVDVLADRPRAEASLGAMSNGSLHYKLPFTFPFYGRSITDISVSKHGHIELLEAGESCYNCLYDGLHAQNAYIDRMDVIFASNGILTGDDGYAKIYHYGDRVMVEWYAATQADNGGAEKMPALKSIAGPSAANNPLHFQVVLFSNGAVAWSFQQMDFTLYDFDMYSGLYAIGSTDVDVGYAINTQSSYLFDPASQTVSAVAYTWDDPAGYIAYDSGESEIDLDTHEVPASATLDVGSSYYWSVRYQNNLGDWTDWSTATRFTIAEATNTTTDTPTDTSSHGSSGAFNPLLALLIGLAGIIARFYRRRTGYAG